MTRDTTSFIYVTYIRATPERVFEAITRPEVARRYWGHENVSDWTPGSTVGARARQRRAHRRTRGRGGRAHAAPASRPHLGQRLAGRRPAKCSRVSFDIVPFDGMVQLTVTHDELEPGSGMAAGISKGWPRVLSSLKSFLETGQAIDVFAKPSDAELTA